MNHQPDSLSSRILSPAVLLFVGVFAFVFALYLQTLAPGVVGGDAGEHQFAVPLLGIPHTTGYPLYVLAGKLWTLALPAGSLAWRMNLFSALGGALAAAVTTLVVYRLAQIPAPRRGATWPGAIAAGVTLAFGLTLWQWSVIAGVRSFNVLFFALLTLEAVIWAEQRRRGDVPAANRTLRWLALTVGLSLAHHRTTIFYLPSLVGWVWWHDRRLVLQPRRLLAPVLLALAPLLLYAFIYFRGISHPPYSHEPISDFKSFWFLVGSGDSTGLFFSIDPQYLPARLWFIWADVLRQLSWPGVLLAGLGALALGKRLPGYLLMQSVLVILLLLFTLDFEVVNLNEAPTWYLMPAYFIFAVWLGAGANAVLDFGLTLLKLRMPNYELRMKRVFAFQMFYSVGLVFLLGASLGWPNWQAQAHAAAAPLDDWRQLLRGEQARRLVDSSLPRLPLNAILWGDWEQYTPFRYAQFIEGRRRDLTVRNPLNNWPQKVAAAHRANQPVYLLRKPADLPGTPYLSMAGPLIFVGDAPQFDLPPDITPANINFENELELPGYRMQLWPAVPPAPAILQLTLVWRAPKKLTWDYALSLRVLDAAGQELFKKDAAHPVLGSYPTGLWTPGEIVTDFYELPLPDGAVAVQVLPYRTEAPGQWHNLTPTGADQPGIILNISR